jgi:hypothetical protein
MKVIHKPHKAIPLIKINHTPKGADHPIQRKKPFFRIKKPKKK